MFRNTNLRNKMNLKNKELTTLFFITRDKKSVNKKLKHSGLFVIITIPGTKLTCFTAKMMFS